MEIYKDLLIAEVRRRLFVENIPRLKKCLGELSEEEIWYRPNEHSNSVGNLVLHLCGNVRQWLIAGLGGHPDTRQRQTEFDERGPVPTQKLIALLDQLQKDAEKTLNEISLQQILSPVKVQGFQETGLSLLIHVVEHFSYHAGQVTYFVKWRKDKDMGYYRGQNLDATS
ncbi:MAG: DUF1572 domain-containing protein [Saprospiraceae bacterium]|nr:MAG: DUF1572 domain-containing protein [Saprospiraceae bacterium]